MIGQKWKTIFFIIFSTFVVSIASTSLFAQSTGSTWGKKFGNFISAMDQQIQKKIDESPKARQATNTWVDNTADFFSGMVTPEADEQTRQLQRDAFQMILNPSRTESDKAFDRMVNNLTGEDNFSSSKGSYGNSSTPATYQRSSNPAYSPTKTSTRSTPTYTVTENQYSTSKKESQTIFNDLSTLQQVKEKIYNLNPNVWIIGVTVIGIVLSIIGFLREKLSFLFISQVIFILLVTFGVWTNQLYSLQRSSDLAYESKINVSSTSDFETGEEFSHIRNTIRLTKQGADREIEFNFSTGHLRVIPNLKFSDKKKKSPREKESNVLKIPRR